MSDPSKAVFLSYASQDAAAAKKISDALRAAGVEVWFDQSDLGGGDAWDAKIRKQIKDCALLIPIISANTQARREGYFRLEWRLADQRTHLMVKGLPFLLPVVIDETRDANAHVPDSFTEVQWTRLPGGEASETFCERVKKLISSESGTGVSPVFGTHGQDARATQNAGPRTSGRRWLAVAVAAASVALGVGGWWISHGPRTPVPPPGAPAAELVARAWEQLNNPAMGRASLALASELCNRATTLDPDNADAWAAWSQVDTWHIYANLDNTPSRREQASAKAARALRAAPHSFEARLAQTCYLVRAVHPLSAAIAAEAENTLRKLLDERTEEPRVLFALGILLQKIGRRDEAAAIFDRMARHPTFAAQALAEKGWLYYLAPQPRFSEALEACNRSVAVQPFWGNLALKELLAQYWLGDPAAAAATEAQMPAEEFSEDFVPYVAWHTQWWRRDPGEMLRALAAHPRDWLQSSPYVGPKALLTGIAQAMAGNPGAAESAWRTGLKQVEQRLEAQPADVNLLTAKAQLQARLGAAADSVKTFDLARQFASNPFRVERLAVVFARDADAALAHLERGVSAGGLEYTAAALRFDPDLDWLRVDPRFAVLLARAESDPRLAPPLAKGSPAPDAKSVAADKSVAVLAFANLSDDKANEYFSDGISEELLNVLAKVPGLKVTARTSSFFFKGNNLPIPEIAKQLGVAYVVEGSVRKAGDKVRITAQLIKAADGFHVWSDTFTRDLKDIFALQDEIAGLVAKALSLRLGAGSPATTARVNPEALRLYLEGRQMWNLRTADGLARADSLFRRALELEPNFARALSGLADLGVVRRSGSGGRLAQREEIVAQAERAIALDPTLADPHATLGLLEFTDWNFAAADTYFQRAFTLNPSYAWAHLWYGQSLMTQGRVEEAMAENQRALEADPLAPRIASNTALLLLLAGRPADALASADRTLSLMAGEPQAQTWKAEALLMLGREAEALKIVREALAIDPKRRDFTYVLARTGTPEERAAAVAAPDPRFANRTRSLLAVGRVEDALAGLAADVQDSVFSFQFVLFHPAFDGVRNDPRFVKMLEASRMAEAHKRAQAWRAANSPQKERAR